MKMSIQSILSRLGFRRGAGRRIFKLDEGLSTELTKLAEREYLSMSKLPSDLIKSAMENRHKSEELWEKWQSLSFREQQVAALTCRGYTNRQIGSKLSISEETVKSHVRNTLSKFKLHGKGELKQVLEGWDFSGWE